MAGEIHERIFQSWQVETGNVLPPSVTRLNFGQIKSSYTTMLLTVES